MDYLLLDLILDRLSLLFPPQESLIPTSNYFLLHSILYTE